MDTVNREEYRYTPKEGFLLTYFLTVADVKRSAEFTFEFLEEKLFIISMTTKRVAKAVLIAAVPPPHG
jgi:hypothetical protein